MTRLLDTALALGAFALALVLLTLGTGCASSGTVQQAASREPTIHDWLHTLPPDMQRRVACAAAALMERGGEAPEGFRCD